MTIIIKGGNDYDYDSIPHLKLADNSLVARKDIN